MEVFAPLIWKRGNLLVLDQRDLPATTTWRACASLDDVQRAIADRRIRGAAAVACAAAYGIVLAARARRATPCDAKVLQNHVEEAVSTMRRTLPASVQVYWALAQMRDAGRVSVATADAHMVVDALESRAAAIHAEDIARCQRIGAAGAELLVDGTAALTLGNHGALATGGWGAALGILRSAYAARKRIRTIACLTGATLTAWELARDGILVTELPDAAAPSLLARREVHVVLLGADRISATGDVVTDLGSYGIALAAAAHQVPLVVAAPAAALDPGAPPPVEVVARDADLVPGNLVSAIVTEHGVRRPPWSESLRA